MNEFPPAAFEQPQPPPEPSPLPAFIAWSIIILIVVGLMVLTNSQRHPSAGTGTSPGADLQLMLLTKLATGTNAISPAAIGPMLAAIPRFAQSPEQKLVEAVVYGECRGGKEALDRLNEIDKIDHPAEIDPELKALKTIYTDGWQAVDDQAGTLLRQRLGYAGELALTYSLPAENPARAAVLTAAKRLTAVLFGVEVLGILSVIAGVILLILAIVLLAVGTLRLAYRPRPDVGSVYVEMFAVYLCSYLALNKLLTIVSAIHPSLVTTWLLTAVPPAFVALGWARLRGQNWPELRQSLGLHAGEGWLIEMPLGIAGYLAGLPVIAVGYATTVYLVQFAASPPTHPLLGEPMQSARQILELLAIASVGAPIVEEIMFRGALFHHMRRRWGWFISAATVAFIFAAVHPQGWATIPALGSIALVLAALREWRGTILASIAAHGMNNGLIMLLLVLIK